MERYYNILKHSLYQKILQSLEFYEKERKFCCHNLEHFCDVARIMYIFALEEQSELTKDLIYATALLHDIGRAKEYAERIPHDEAGMELAKVILTDVGYQREEIDKIVQAIGSHREKESLKNSLGTYLYKADKLSRKCFCCKAADECYWDESKKNHTIII